MRFAFLRLVKQKGWIILCLLVGFAILFTISVHAMESTNYKMEWYVPLSGGGGSASSANYAMDYTVGQTVIGNSSSAHYSTGLGFWAGIWNWIVSLPLILK
jgi:hypothetical protein